MVDYSKVQIFYLISIGSSFTYVSINAFINFKCQKHSQKYRTCIEKWFANLSCTACKQSVYKY